MTGLTAVCGFIVRFPFPYNVVTGCHNTTKNPVFYKGTCRYTGTTCICTIYSLTPRFTFDLKMIFI